MRPLLVQGARLASIGSEAMIDYNSAAQNRTVVDQTLLSEQTTKRTELEVFENTPTLSGLVVESNTRAIPSSSQDCLGGSRVPFCSCFGVSQ